MLRVGCRLQQLTPVARLLHLQLQRVPGLLLLLLLLFVLVWNNCCDCSCVVMCICCMLDDGSAPDMLSDGPAATSSAVVKGRVWCLHRGE